LEAGEELDRALPAVSQSARERACNLEVIDLSAYWVFRYLSYGTGMTAAALALAWFLNWVFERYFPAIALILLAMLIVTLVHRMIEGGIPEQPPPDERTARADQADSVPEDAPSIHEETRHLPGVDARYGWMALPPLLTAIVVLVTIFI
jgi:MFS superfamily sulfate permease-like transporter